MAQMVSFKKVVNFVGELLNDVMHVKRAWSIGAAAFGAMLTRRLNSADIGQAMAEDRGTLPKHAIKQVDRLMGNEKFDMEVFFTAWVPWVVSARKEIIVSLD